MGGPQCGIILGSKQALERISKHPMMRALRLDKTILAALNATLDIYLSPAPAERIPVLQLLSESLESLRDRAEALAAKLNELAGISASTNEDITYLGGGSVPTQEIKTWTVAIHHDQLSDDRLSAALRSAEPAILGRIRQDEFHLDLRSVFSSQDQQIIQAMETLILN